MSGERIFKSHDRIEALGDIDELPSASGLLRVNLPFGHPAAVQAHMARSICRRTERHAILLSVQVSVGKPSKILKWAIVYLNRLSDYLFVTARYLNYRAGIPDDFWRH